MYQKFYESHIFSTDNFSRYLSWVGFCTISRNENSFFWKPCSEFLSTMKKNTVCLYFKYIMGSCVLAWGTN